MAINIRDVAREAGVSISTVSKVINGKARVAQDTRERVEQVIERLHFYPNNIARAFVHQSTFSIGVLMATKKGVAFSDPYPFEILSGIEDVAYRNGYLVTLSNIKESFESDRAFEHLVMEKRVDGLIIHGSTPTRAVVSKLESLSFPHVLIGQPDFNTNLCWVDINNRIAGEIATEHLVAIGRTRPGFIGGASPRDLISSRRLIGFREVLGRNGIKIPASYVQKGDSGEKGSGVLMQRLIDLDQRPDSVVCTNNFAAYGAMSTIKKNGLRIPEDIAVVSFDNYPLSPYLDPPLTVVDIDLFDLGVLAAKALMDTLSKPTLQVQYSMLVPNLIVRGSTQPA
jgi:DNA-binding LacI/PurR family transcriptional regulator